MLGKIISTIIFGRQNKLLIIIFIKQLKTKPERYNKLWNLELQKFSLSFGHSCGNLDIGVKVWSILKNSIFDLTVFKVILIFLNNKLNTDYPSITLQYFCDFLQSN